MKNKYWAAFVLEDDGYYSVSFPDVPGAITEGASIEEAFDMAEDALSLVLQDMAARQKQIPSASPLSKAIQAAKNERQEDGLPWDVSQVVFQLVHAPNLDMTPVRINVSLPKFALEEVDRKAALVGMTRSGFLAKAAASYNVG